MWASITGFSSQLPELAEQPAFTAGAHPVHKERSQARTHDAAPHVRVPDSEGSECVSEMTPQTGSQNWHLLKTPASLRGGLAIFPFIDPVWTLSNVTR